ncbi:MAG: P-type conjugative transfer protein TrbL [Hyphomonas sp. 34-62-18]|nr:P-type conjugative transfer protein TrbL [Hyphomonas sp. 34-62-18]OZB12709.1 MAG: P-type conjugative transfer protein TrbL [Hyphomonas sp. 34-62-18]
MEEMDVIDRFLATFIAYIDSGFGLLAGDVAYLTSTLIVLDITLAGLFWALSENADVIAGLIKKVLYVGFFAFLLGNFAFLSQVIFDSFAGLGLTAGSSLITAEDLMRPGYIAGVGFNAALPLLEEAGELMGPIAFFENFVLISVLLLAWAVIMIAFFVLAVQLFVAILEFKLVTLAGFVLVPFALWNKTAFLAERVLGNVITSGLKLMVLAIIIGIGSTLFATITDAFSGTEDITLAEVMGTVLAALVFLWMGVFGPGMASGLITGAPQLGAGSAIGAAAGVAAGTVAAGLGAKAVLGSAAAGAASAVKAGASMAGGARTAFDLGSTASGKTGAAGFAAGLGSVVQAAGDTVRRAAARPASGVRDAYRRGASGAFDATGGSRATPPDPPAASPPVKSPGWARGMQASQRFGEARQLALHSLRDGDRGSSGAAPTLKDKED